MVPMRFSSASRRMVSAGVESTSRKAKEPVIGPMSGTEP